MRKTILINEKQLSKGLLTSEEVSREELFKEHKYAPGQYFYPECIRKYINTVDLNQLKLI